MQKALSGRSVLTRLAGTSFVVALVACPGAPRAIAESQYWYTPQASKRIAAELVDVFGAEVTLRFPSGETVSVNESRLNGANRLYLHAYRLAEEGQAHLRRSPYSKDQRRLANLVDGFVDIRGIQYRVRSIDVLPDGSGVREIVVDNGFSNGTQHAITPADVEQIQVLPYTWQQPATRLGATPSDGSPFSRRGPPRVPLWPVKNRWKYQLVFSDDLAAWTDVETKTAHSHFTQSRAYLGRFRSAIRFASANWHIHQGRSHVVANRLDTAVGFFDIATQLEPNFADGYLERGILYKRRGDYRRSLVDLNQAVELAGRYEEVSGARRALRRSLSFRCAVHSFQRSHDAAVDDAKRVLALSEGQSRVAAQLVLVKAASIGAAQTAAVAQRFLDSFHSGGDLTSDDIDRAIRESGRAVDFDQMTVKPRRSARLQPSLKTNVYATLQASCARLPSDDALRKANAEFERKQYRHAIDLAAVAVDKNPNPGHKLYEDEYRRLLNDGGESLLALSQEALAANRHDEAIQTAQGAFDVCDGNSLVTARRGGDRVVASLLVRARRVLAVALSARAVQVHFKSRQFQEAIADLDEVVRIGAADRETHEFLGRAHMSLRDYATAREHFSKVVGVQGEAIAARYLRGWCSIQLAEFAAATKDFTRLIELDATEGSFWEGRAWANRGGGEHEPAVRDISRAIDLDSGNPDYLLFRAHSQFVRDELDKADADIRAVLKRSPENSAAADLRAAVNKRRLALAEVRRRADPYFMDTEAVRDVLPNLARGFLGLGLEGWASEVRNSDAGGFGFRRAAGAAAGHLGKLVREKAIIDGVDKVWPNLPREERSAVIQAITKLTDGRLSFEDVGEEALVAAMVGVLDQYHPRAGQIAGAAKFLADLYRGLQRG